MSDKCRVLCLLTLLFVVGCGGKRPVPNLVVDKSPDCVNDPFNYDFYSNEDQKRITYCYAVLQTMVKQKAGPE
jgi:hypothetical protein